MRLVLQTVKVLVSELATNSNCLQHVSLVTTLLVVVVAAMDFYAKQMTFTMGNAFLKTRVSHAGVAMLPTVTDKPVFVAGIVLTDIPRNPDRLFRRLLGASATARVETISTKLHTS